MTMFTSDCVRELRDLHNFRLNVYKGNFIGHNFWREIMQTLYKDETFSSVHMEYAYKWNILKL